MKNIHLIPTEKPSRLAGVKYITNVQGIDKRIFKFKLWNKYINNKDLKNVGYITHHIYITSDEEIKNEGWHYNFALNIVEKTTEFDNGLLQEKIILTTDEELIKNGVQAISDEFLKWFVKNPNCERVKTIHGLFNPMGRQVDSMNLSQNHSECVWKYKIVIPKE